MAANDKIGIELAGGTMQWTTIASISTLTVNLNAALTGAVASGATVFAYTNKVANPLEVLNVAWHDTASNVDMPLTRISMEEFDNIPSKADTGDPQVYCVDSQLAYKEIRLWPIPVTVEDYLKVAVSREIEDMDNTTDNLDFPKVWEQVLVDWLVIRVAPAFNKEAKVSKLMVQLAQAGLENAKDFDNEVAVLKWTPTYEDR
jgi:hypothetical protein